MSKNKTFKSLTPIYGPVPSRRLGFSLGIDILPLKTCSFSCVYCQLGRTTRKTVKRREYIPVKEILSQIKKILASKQRIDYITFSGSGEPTLNTAISGLIREIKKMTSIPVAVLTNSSLFSRKEVRRALLEADLVIPSLDAASPEVFSRVNRPHPSLKIEKIIDGLKNFRKEYKGKIWLEIMLVKGINDKPSDLRKLKEAIASIQPDKVQLNTVIRPPAEKFALPLSPEELKKIRRFLGGNCEIIADFKKREQLPSPESLEKAILSLTRRRPVTLEDIASSLGKSEGKIKNAVQSLLEKRKLKFINYKKKIYYRPEFRSPR